MDEQALLKRLARYVKSIKERGGEWLGGTEFETEDGHHTDAMPGRSWWGLWLKWGPVAGFYRQTTHGREYFSLEAGGSPVWTGNMEGHGNWLDATYKELWLEAVQKMLERLDQVARPLGKTPEQVHDSGFNRAAEQVQQWLAEKEAGLPTHKGKWSAIWTNEGRLTINWSREGVGFGQVTLYGDHPIAASVDPGKTATYIDSETLGREFVKELLEELVKDAVFDTDLVKGEGASVERRRRHR